MCSSNSEDIEHSSTSGFQKDWLRLLLKMNTILLSLLVINLHQIQSISTFWSCSDFSVKKKLLETKILNDDHSGRSMRLVGKQYCRHRQALWHPEQVSGEHQKHHCHYVSPLNHWCRPSVSKIPHVPGSPILTLNAIFSENVETRSCKSWHLLRNFSKFLPLAAAEAAPVDLRSLTCQLAHGLQVCLSFPCHSCVICMSLVAC